MPKKFSWIKILIKEINDTKNILMQIPEVAVVIKDKYPKAKFHFLVICFQDLANIYSLNRRHLSLLDDMHLLANNIITLKNLCQEDFKLGFHRVPSLDRLHLHVISKDFSSNCLKTAKHWISFNSNLFIDFDVLYRELDNNGCIKQLDKDVLSATRLASLQCNQCTFQTSRFAELKKHLNQHQHSNN